MSDSKMFSQQLVSELRRRSFDNCEGGDNILCCDSTAPIDDWCDGCVMRKAKELLVTATLDADAPAGEPHALVMRLEEVLLALNAHAEFYRRPDSQDFTASERWTKDAEAVRDAITVIAALPPTAQEPRACRWCGHPNWQHGANNGLAWCEGPNCICKEFVR